MMMCPTCKRRPSDRMGVGPPGTPMPKGVMFYDCPDPIHDLADQAPALLEALELVLPLVAVMDPTSPDDPEGDEVVAIYCNARAAIFAAKGGPS